MVNHPTSTKRFSTFSATTSIVVSCLTASFLWSAFSWSADTSTQNALLEQALSGGHRQQSALRDQYRNPRETLRFFDVQPHHTVVEIWPGGSGWYTEILAPYLRSGIDSGGDVKDGNTKYTRGTLYAAHFAIDSPVPFFRNARQSFTQKLSAQPDIYDQVILTTFTPPSKDETGQVKTNSAKTEIAPPNSADRVLTFRNVHNWYMGGGEKAVTNTFKIFYRALKPGGILGVVDHRLPEGAPDERMASSGYMKQSFVIHAAEKAGFKLLATSDINANPKDTANHTAGVWSLPPTLREGDVRRDEYLAIGESDRMTLKFVKSE